MAWTVRLSGRSLKKIRALPRDVGFAVQALLHDLQEFGPTLPSWPHFGKIKGHKGCYHCHVQRGRPTYVAVWRATGPLAIEVIYVGTHEGADYQRLC